LFFSNSNDKKKKKVEPSAFMFVASKVEKQVQHDEASNKDSIFKRIEEILADAKALRNWAEEQRTADLKKNFEQMLKKQGKESLGTVSKA
jgi:hypothetical protein